MAQVMYAIVKSVYLTRGDSAPDGTIKCLDLQNHFTRPATESNGLICERIRYDNMTYAKELTENAPFTRACGTELKINKIRVRKLKKMTLIFR